MSPLRIAAPLLALATLSAPAHAIMFQTRAEIGSMLAQDRYSGVGTLSFGGVSGAYCTASLVGANVVITATHCLPSGGNNQFVLQGADGPSAYRLIASAIAPHYATGLNTDLAVITLGRRVTGQHEIYSVQSDRDELGSTFTMVGAGATGILSEGLDPDLPGGVLRYGYNRYDMLGSDFTEGFNRVMGYEPDRPQADDLLFYDYDNGRSVNDVFGRYLGVADTGVTIDGVLKESGISYGDSGGPDFINGRIAGIHSFGFSGSVFDGQGGVTCGQPGNVDPVSPSIYFGCYDDSAGDIGASVRVSYYADFINRYVAEAALLPAVPEPSSWAMMILGIGMTGGVLRQRALRHRTA